MSQISPKPLIVQAVEALQRGQRDAAVALMQCELREGPPHGDRYRSFARLAARIGELDMALEGMRRFASTPPVTIDRLLHYLGDLVEFGRMDRVKAELAQIPASLNDHPGIRHFLGTVASQEGDFAAAEAHFRVAIRQGIVPQTWFALSAIKKFTPGDPDLAQMEAILPHLAKVDGNARAAFLYGLAKAYDDCGDVDRAFALYAQGAALRHDAAPYDPERTEAATDALLRDFVPENMARLAPSDHAGSRALFVNGLPRSGTTLVEQILVGHSTVKDGGEINLFRAALSSHAGLDWPSALAFQQRHPGNAWGDVARDYERMLAMRFGAEGRIVDKTLLQSRMMGQLLHALPAARVLWLRRDPADCALSCFRTYFSSDIPWSWSFADIGHYFRQEDRLFRHWTQLFPDRILVIPYEDLVADPTAWIARIAAHSGLEEEAEMQQSHQVKRSVRTASVMQVRSPISTAAVGKADPYRERMQPFFDAYQAG